jgi:hypothetical protein
MSHSRADLLFHAARFSLERLDWLAGDMRRALGLGRLPCLPFLARWQLRQLTRFLAQAEPLLRRLILLMAADLGALAARPQTDPATRAVPGKAAPTRALFPMPHFRLCEALPGKTLRTPPPKRFRTGPRIRLLDAVSPIDLSDYPADPHDILPATRQVRRLLALEHALENLPRYVEAMRRLLAGPRPVIARALPPAFNRLPVTRAQQATLADLHAAAVRDNPDTS